MIALQTDKQFVLKNILFATDFSQASEAALPFAVSMAREHGAMLHAAHVMFSESHLFAKPDSWAGLVREEEERAIAELGKVERKLQSVRHSTLLRTGDVREALEKLVEERNIDLVVLGTRSRSDLPELTGSVADQVLRNSSCPVLTIGSNVCGKPQAVTAPRRILFATNFSQASLSALPLAITIANKNESEILLLHVMESHEAHDSNFGPTAAFLLNRLKDLVPLETGLRRHSRSFVVSGSPLGRILEFADCYRADLIVLGLRAAPKNAAAGLISTAYEVAARASCPVLSIRAATAPDWRRQLPPISWDRASECRLHSGAS